LKDPWHRSLHGGHTQLEPFLDGQNSDTQRWDDEFRAHSRGAKFEREILVALQPIHGQRDTWRALAAQIARAPRTWRWWIRRHPASAGSQDVEFGPLLTGRAGNVEVEAASTMPLPALLRHMSVLISVASGAATEAASFGVPALFLSESARGPFNALIERRVATVVATEDVNDSIARISAVATRPPAARAPRLPDTLERLEQIADEYRSLYRNQLMTRREVPLPGP
jgi:hypothetical protein